MYYFNYFIKCLIRRFVRLFFTKKTFIFLLVLVLFFFFSFKTFAYGYSESVLYRSLRTLYVDSNVLRCSNQIISDNFYGTINISKRFYIYRIVSGSTYYFTYKDSIIPCYICYDMNFAQFVQNDFVSSGGSPTTFTTVYPLEYYIYNNNVKFTSGNDFFVLFDASQVDTSSLVCRQIFEEATTSDITSQTNTIVSQSQATQNTIKDSTDMINNTLTDSNVTVSTDLPTDNTNDITESGFNNIFITIRNTFTSSSSQDLVLTIPFTGKSFTINFANVYGGFNSGIVGTLITLFWWYLVSVFIVKDISNKISKIKSGNIESIENTNIKEDIL